MKYLTAEQLIHINTRIIQKYSPLELIGVREEVGLNAVVEAPKITVFGEDAYPTIFDKATIFLLGVAGKQLFQNANKRTAIAATNFFFTINGYDATWEHDEYLAFVKKIVSVNESLTTDFDELKKYTSNKLREKYTMEN